MPYYVIVNPIIATPDFRHRLICFLPTAHRDKSSLSTGQRDPSLSRSLLATRVSALSGLCSLASHGVVRLEVLAIALATRAALGGEPWQQAARSAPKPSGEAEAQNVAERDCHVARPSHKMMYGNVWIAHACFQEGPPTFVSPHQDSSFTDPRVPPPRAHPTSAPQVSALVRMRGLPTPSATPPLRLAGHSAATAPSPSPPSRFPAAAALVCP